MAVAATNASPQVPAKVSEKGVPTAPLALTSAGAERKAAYEAVQRAAMKTWKGEGTFAENAKREPEITAKLSSSEIDDLCSLDVHFKHVDATFKALGLE